MICHDKFVLNEAYRADVRVKPRLKLTGEHYPVRYAHDGISRVMSNPRDLWAWVIDEHAWILEVQR